MVAVEAVAVVALAEVMEAAEVDLRLQAVAEEEAVI